jgi:hypothetical protein
LVSITDMRRLENGARRRIDARKDQPVTVAKQDELQVDQMKLLRVGHKRIVLARTEKGYVAFDDRPPR